MAGLDGPGLQTMRAMDYMLKRWDGFARFLDEGRIRLTNETKRARRGVALGRKS